jgi:hypothetical protein
MTIDELNDMRFLPKEIQGIDEDLTRLHTAPRAEWMRTREYKDAVSELCRLLLKRRDRCTRQLDRLRAFIDSIPDQELQRLFRLRYERGCTWEEISTKSAFGGGCLYSEEAAKKACYRYLQKVNENEQEQ